MDGSFLWYVTTLPSLGPIGLLEKEIFLFHHVISPHNITKGPCSFMVWEPLKVSQLVATFGTNSCGGSGSVAHLVCHVIWQDHLIKGSCIFMGRTFSQLLPPCQIWRS